MIKRNLLFCLFLSCIVIYLRAMDLSGGGKSLWELAYEKFLKDRKEAFEKLGKPVPDGPTYQEAIVQHIKSRTENERAMMEEGKKEQK